MMETPNGKDPEPVKIPGYERWVGEIRKGIIFWEARAVTVGNGIELECQLRPHLTRWGAMRRARRIARKHSAPDRTWERV